MELIFRKSERELRERAYESRPRGFRQGRNIDGYARGPEEAERLLRSRGRDKPQAPILMDADTKVNEELAARVRRRQ